MDKPRTSVVSDVTAFVFAVLFFAVGCRSLYLLIKKIADEGDTTEQEKRGMYFQRTEEEPHPFVILKSDHENAVDR